MRLPFAAYLDAISEEAMRLEDAGEGHLDHAVPARPSCTIGGIIGELTGDYARWAAQVRAGADEVVEEAVAVGRHENAAPTPAHRNGAASTAGDALHCLEAALAGLISALEQNGPDARCWNWTGEDQTAAWVARRLALETALYRHDAETARGRATPIERELAVDGVDERLEVYLSGRHRAGALRLGGTVGLVCSDDEAAWLVEVDRDRLRFRRGRGPAAVVLVGRASDIFLFTWNRLAPESLQVTGDPHVAQAFSCLPA